VLSLVWIGVVVFAFTKFTWRASWFLLATPLAGYGFFVLYRIASGCAQNVNNCPDRIRGWRSLSGVSVMGM
jgi:hypothetical protein